MITHTDGQRGRQTDRQTDRQTARTTISRAPAESKGDKYAFCCLALTIKLELCYSLSTKSWSFKPLIDTPWLSPRLSRHHDRRQCIRAPSELLGEKIAKLGSNGKTAHVFMRCDSLSQIFVEPCTACCSTLACCIALQPAVAPHNTEYCDSLISVILL